MTIQEFAKQLDGLEYPVRVPSLISNEALQAGIVIVFGASDDLIEFEGAISDEAGVNNGGSVMVSQTGLLTDFEQVDKNDKEALREYFANEGKGREIEALWGEGEYSWTYKTDIPHATFEVMEDGDKYCRGIVFKLSDCGPSPSSPV